MTVSSAPNRISYAGNGVTTGFSFPYYFRQQADLKVSLYDTVTGVTTPLVLNTTFTITGTVNPDFGYKTGGTVTLSVAPPTGKTVVVFRDPTLIQDLNLPTGGPLPMAPLESELDLLTMIGQRSQEQVQRSVKLADGFGGTFNPDIPTDLNLVPGATMIVGPLGDKFVTGPTADNIASASASATAAAASATAANGSQTAAAASAVAAAASAAAVYRLYQAIVGGLTGCTHANLAAALADVTLVAGSRVLVVSNETVDTAPITLSKTNWLVEFLPGVTFTQGTSTTGLSITASGVRIKGGRFLNFTTTAINIDAAAQNNFVTECRFANCTNEVIEAGSAPNNVIMMNISE